MDKREMKALELAAQARILFLGGYWLVPSQSAPSTNYRVSIQPPSCECDDFQTRQQPCKHIRAAELVNERQGGTQAPPIDTDTPPQKKTYSQDWPAYARRRRLRRGAFRSCCAT